jgi:hypothetical protein
MNKQGRAESYNSSADFDSDLVGNLAISKDYNTDLDKKNKSNTIDDRDMGHLENTQNNMIVAVRLRPLGKKEIDREEFEIVRIMDKSLVILMDIGTSKCKRSTW